MSWNWEEIAVSLGNSNRFVSCPAQGTAPHSSRHTGRYDAPHGELGAALCLPSILSEPSQSHTFQRFTVFYGRSYIMCPLKQTCLV